LDLFHGKKYLNLFGFGKNKAQVGMAMRLSKYVDEKIRVGREDGRSCKFLCFYED
jgi:hypothetical protein